MERDLERHHERWRETKRQTDRLEETVRDGKGKDRFRKRCVKREKPDH